MEQLSPEEVKLNPGLIEGLDGEFVEIPIENFISSPEMSKPVVERIMYRKSKEEKTLYKFEIEDRIIQSAIEITDKLGEDALSIYRRLPKKIKTSLKYEKDKIFENLAKIEWNDETAYLDKKIVFLHYASILNMGFLKSHKVSVKMGDAYKSSCISI